MQRILVAVPNWIGDCLMATPFLRVLKENVKDCHLGILAHKRVLEIFANSPFVDEIIEFDEKENIFSKLSLVSKLVQKNFDTAFLLKPSFTKSLICKLAGVKDIFGYKLKKFTFINRAKELESGDIHKMDYYLNLLEGLGFKRGERKSEFFLDEESREKAKQILSNLPQKRFKIILHPKANWLLKMWPQDYFAKLADQLIAKLDALIIITGLPGDLNLALRIKDLMDYKPYILAGKTTLRELAGLLKEVNLFISADTGIMHLAASLNTPLIALFGPTCPSLSGPRGKGLIKVLYKDVGCKVPCYKLNCKENICMKSISVDEVAKEALKILTQNA